MGRSAAGAGTGEPPAKPPVRGGVPMRALATLRGRTPPRDGLVRRRLGYDSRGGGVSGSSDRLRIAWNVGVRGSSRSATTASRAVGRQNGSTPADVVMGRSAPPQVPSTHGALRDPAGALRESAWCAAVRWQGGALAWSSCAASADLRQVAQSHWWWALPCALQVQRCASTGASMATARGAPDSVTATSTAATRAAAAMRTRTSISMPLYERRRERSTVPPAPRWASRRSPTSRGVASTCQGCRGAPRDVALPQRHPDPHPPGCLARGRLAGGGIRVATRPLAGRSEARPGSVRLGPGGAPRGDLGSGAGLGSRLPGELPRGGLRRAARWLRAPRPGGGRGAHRSSAPVASAHDARAAPPADLGLGVAPPRGVRAPGP